MTISQHRTPEEQAAQRFMAHKGYGDAQPFQVDELPGQDCWYFVYSLPEGVLELEVSWQDGDWDVRVSAFKRD